jgi:hypothetical protein
MVGSVTAKRGSGLRWRIVVSEARQPLAVACRHFAGTDRDVEHFVAYVFGYTAAGVLDIVGFHVEPSSSMDESHERAAQVAKGSRLGRPRRGLRSRQLRAAVTQGGLIDNARTEMERYARRVEGEIEGFFPVAQVSERGSHLDDLFLAQFVLDYDELLRGGATRADVAKRHDRNAKTIENWVEKAKRRGLWATSGSGTRGQPTVRARQLVEGVIK